MAIGVIGAGSANSSSHVIGNQGVRLSPELGFQMTLQKVEGMLQRANQSSGTSDPIDPERVRFLSTTLWQYIQYKTRFVPPATEEALSKEIDAWMEPVKMIDLEEGSLNVMVLLNDKGRLGEGGESTVYRGILEPQGRACAVKLMNKAKSDDEINHLDQMLKNVCQSRYLVHYYGFNDEFVMDPKTGEYLEDDEGEYVVNQHLVEELCSESLWELCEAAEVVPGPETTGHLNNHLPAYTEQILLGVSYMHSRDLIHGDIKLDNILLSQSRDEIRISDLNGVVSVNEKPRAATLYSSAPEQVDHSQAFYLNGQELPRPDDKKREVWQTMLAIAEMNVNRLSPEFRGRIENHLQTCRGYEDGAVSQANADPRSTDIDKRNFLKATFYTEKVVPHFAKMRGEREGLFSDLHPTNGLERLLVSMSIFDPERRVSAEQALEMFRDAR